MPGRFRGPEPENDLKTILHEPRHHAFRMIGSKCFEIRGRRDDLRNSGSIFFQLTLRSDVAQLRRSVCFVFCPLLREREPMLPVDWPGHFGLATDV